MAETIVFELEINGAIVSYPVVSLQAFLLLDLISRIAIMPLRDSDLQMNVMFTFDM